VWPDGRGTEEICSGYRRRRRSACDKDEYLRMMTDGSRNSFCLHRQIFVRRDSHAVLSQLFVTPV
jgi:hypothetical protein